MIRIARCSVTLLALWHVALWLGQTQANAAWWRDVESRSLAELRPDDFRDGTASGWTVLHGKLELVSDVGDDSKKQDTSDPNGGHSQALEAKTAVRLWVGNSDWQRYAVTAEVKLQPARYVYLAAACERDGSKVAVGYELGLAAVKGRPFLLMTRAHDRNGRLPRPRVTSMGRVRDGPEVASWLKPDFNRWLARIRQRNRERAEKLAESYEREFEDVSTHQQRWFRLRIEVTPYQVRMWYDGILVASVDRPKWCHGGVSLLMMPGSQVRSVRVETLPELADGFLPLDLTALCNGAGVGGDPGDRRAFDPAALPQPDRFVEVQGIPFLWTAAAGRANTLDVSRAIFREQQAYILTGADRRDTKRVMLRVPKRQYRALAIIAAANTDKNTSNILNVRMFKCERGNVLDACHPIPRWDDCEPQKNAYPLPAARMLLNGKPIAQEGRLWLVRIPLDPGAFQDFLASPNESFLEFDLISQAKRKGHPPTKDERVGVHILAATLVESPVEMVVTSDEYGHVFVEPQTPTFSVRLRNTTDAPKAGTVCVQATDFYGKAETQRVQYTLAAGQAAAKEVSVPVKKRGLHYLDVRVCGSDGTRWVRRQTTFAHVPPGVRQDRDDSPFGMWVFPKAHYGAGEEAACSLMSKIGVRWAHGFSEAPPEQYRIRRAYYTALHRRGTLDEVRKQIEGMPDVDYLSVFGEDAISHDHCRLFPPELLEAPKPIPLTDEQEKKFQDFWDKGVAYSEMVRKHFPDKILALGHGYPQFISTLLSRKFPRRYFDGLHLDFMGDRMNFFYYLRQVAEHYGYHDVPFHTYECFCVGSDRGYFPDRKLEERQADIYVQGLTRGLAMGIVRFAATPEIWDPGGWFHWTGYGNVGVCHTGPELNPKPAYTAYGTMTRVLDRAKFHSLVPTGSTVTYVARFEKDSGPVYAAWTIRGRRRLEFDVTPDTNPILTDSQGNSRALNVADGKAGFSVTMSPLWLESAGIVQRFLAGIPVYDTAPTEHAERLLSFGNVLAWNVDNTPYSDVEALDPSFPVKQSEFTLARTEGRRPGTSALAVALKPEPTVSPHRFRYTVLRPGKDFTIPVGTRQLGLWIRGNGAAWVDLEMQDARGKLWTTVRLPPRYDFGMQYRGPHAFDGWRYVTYPLTRPDETKRWPSHFRSGFRTSGIELPAKLTGIILQQYAQVLCVNTLVPPSPETWKIGELTIELTAQTQETTGEGETQFAPAPGQATSPLQ